MSNDQVLDSEPKPKKLSATQLSCGCLLAILFLVALVPGIAFLVWNERNAQEIERRLAEVRKQGLPTTFAELAEYSALPRRTADTTQLWLDGVKPLVDPAVVQSPQSIPFVGRGKLPPPVGEPWDEIGVSEAFLEQHAASLEKFHEAAELGGAASFPTNYAAGALADLNHFQNQRAAARILKLETLVHAHRGNVGPCAKSIRSQFAVSRSLRHAPYLVSHLIQISIRAMALDSVAETIGRVPFTDEDLHSFQTEIRSWKGTDALSRAVATERVIGVEKFHSGELGGKRVPFFKPDFALYLEICDDLQSTSESGDFLQVDAVKAKVAGNRGSIGVTRTMTTLSLPAFEATFRATARVVSVGRATDTAIGVVLFHRKTGKLPASLVEITPEFLKEVPHDEFDGKPLRYRQVDDGFVVYSVGQDLIDQGGKTDQEPRVDEVVHVRMTTKK